MSIETELKNIAITKLNWKNIDSQPHMTFQAKQQVYTVVSVWSLVIQESDSAAGGEPNV